MLWIDLGPEQRAELQALRRDHSFSPAERDCLEMVALSAAGWSVPAIATHLGRTPETVCRLFRRFPSEGLAAGGARRPAHPRIWSDAGQSKPNCASCSARSGLGPLASWSRRWPSAASGSA